MKRALLLAPMGSVHRRFNRANIAALKELGYEVHLLANFDDGEGPEKQNSQFVEQAKQEGLILHHIPYARHSLFRNLGCVKQTRRLLKQEKFDLVHTHTETGGLVLRMATRGCKKGMRLIYTPHGLSFWQGSSLKSQLVYRPVERWIFSGMEKNLSMNTDDDKVFRAWNPKKAGFVHGAGMDLSRICQVKRSRESVRAEFGIPTDATVLFSVGELDENKNHRLVIAAIANMQRDDLYYVICGVGPQQENLLRQANEGGVTDRVILAGYRSDVPDLLAAFDLFIFPSYHEGLPAALMEAMAAGLPILCSEIRGNRDLIQDGENGYLFALDQDGDFEKKLKLLLENKEQWSRFAIENKKRILDYSVESVQQELKAIYQSGDRVDG
ncbi:MAG: glycosyltransferase [Clostridia bacterium]|nr:glycosyltransferase [Clostridia bacterium]